MNDDVVPVRWWNMQKIESDIACSEGDREEYAWIEKFLPGNGRQAKITY